MTSPTLASLSFSRAANPSSSARRVRRTLRLSCAFHSPISPHFREIDDSLFWGICQILNIPSCVNAKDKAYQKAYRSFLVRLAQAREQAGLTQVEVAARLGKARTFISKCELGERRVDFIELQQLARIYGKDLSFFQE